MFRRCNVASLIESKNIYWVRKDPGPSTYSTRRGDISDQLLDAKQHKLV